MARLRSIFIVSLMLVLAAILPARTYAQTQIHGFDAVLIFDTSGPMLDEIDRVCAQLPPEVDRLHSLGFDLQVTYLGITSSYTCAKDNVGKLFSEASVRSDDDWGAAVADVAAHFNWRSNTLRVIVPISNRGPGLGDPIDDPGPDRDAVQRAIKAAQFNHVIVSPLIGAPDRAARPEDRPRLERLANDLAKGTGGQADSLKASTLTPDHDVLQLLAKAAQSSGRPMQAIPGAVRTLTCQRDSVKCISFDPGVLFTNLGLAVLFTVIAGFSAALLDQSLARIHPPKVEGRVFKALGRGARQTQAGLRSLFAPEAWTIGSAIFRRSLSIVLLVIFIGLTALFAAFVDPEFNPGTPRGIGIFLSLFAAIGLISLLYSQVQRRAARSQGFEAALRIRPLNLIVIIAAALLSRAIGFLPGFIIGLPASYALLAETEESAKAQTRIVSVGLIGVAIAALLSWLLAIPLDLLLGNLITQAANAASLGVDIAGTAQSFLLTIYVIALELAFVVLLPLKPAGGQRIYTRSRLLWGLSFGIVTFAALHTLINPTLSGLDVFQNPALLVLGGALAVLTGVALSVWLSVNERQLRGDAPINQRSILNAIVVIAAWGLVCACGAITFAARSINWGNVLIVLVVLAILAIGGFIAVRLRSLQSIEPVTPDEEQKKE